jgi:hypothetical protein
MKKNTDNQNYFLNKMEQVKRSSFKLSELTDLNDLDLDEIFLLLKPMYDSKNMVHSGIASVLNAILTHRRIYFLKSNKDIKELIEGDQNIKAERKGAQLSSKEFGRVLSGLKNHFIEEVISGSRAPNIPAVWKLVDTKMVEYILINESNPDLFNQDQEHDVLEWHDSISRRFRSNDKSDSKFTQKKRPSSHEERYSSKPPLQNYDEDCYPIDEPIVEKEKGFRREKRIHR